MQSYQHILDKLKGFLNRYYTRQLLQGVFLFLFFGGLLLLLIAGLEYFLWMPPQIRTLVFWALILLEAVLLVRYILFPILRMARLKKGLSLKEGSEIIGTHFPEVGDRLRNLLDLADAPGQTELLIASIEQRSQSLKGVPFGQAIRYRAALKYAKYALVPIGILALLVMLGKARDLYESYQRVVHYSMNYEKPAPFQFQLLNTDLRVVENRPFTLKVRTLGEVSPDQMDLVINGKRMVMEDGLTHFEYTFRPPLETLGFYLESNGIRSREYQLEVLNVPLIDQFTMKLRYPDYLGRPTQTLKGTGNAVIPEGTEVQWEISAIHTNTVQYKDKDTVFDTRSRGDVFQIDHRAFRTTDYTISTSNNEISEYDILRYRLEVIPDEHPAIEVAIVRDSLNPNQAYFSGILTDDHGLSSLKVGVFPEENREDVQVLELSTPSDIYHSFYYTFPSGFSLSEGRDYIVFFEVTDNDGLRGGKRSRSRDFRIRLLDADEKETKQLEYQKSLLKNLGKSQREREALQEELQRFNEEQREKGNLNFNDQERLEEVLNRQVKQERLMQKFSKELSENLEELPENNEFKELLQERLERQELEARKNEALMNEMQKVLDKLDKEALRERMEEMGKKQATNQRSLEQLLELTKRYYVEQQAAALSRKLEKMSEKQEVLPALNENTKDLGRKEQEKLNRAFDSLRLELEQLEKDNQELRKPLPWQRDAGKEEDVQTDQQEALELLEKTKGEENASESNSGESAQSARKRQRSAARKMKELAEKLRSDTAAGGSSGSAEDAEMLRQILDNLVVFSFEQEGLYEVIQGRKSENLHNGGDIRRQQELRKLFEHVDDSLFALSLRRPEISEQVNTQIEEVYYNIDKSLESLSENQWYRGASYQQYVITASNELAAMLAENLENMQESMRPGSGQGGGDQQLPDIIKSQEELRQQMQESGSSGQQSGQSGQEGQQGQSGEDGQGEESGQQGESGSQDGEGEGEGQKPGEGEGNSGGEGKGSQEGSDNGTGEGSGTGNSELSYEEIFEIYKEQQKIRQQLEEQLKDMIEEGDRSLAKRIAQEMEQFESELLRNGITQRTADRLNRIQQQLMRLENAALQQGQKEERESTTNKNQFANPVITKPEIFENEGIDSEILNKQVLPLRGIYKEKVRTYFRENGNLPL